MSENLTGALSLGMPRDAALQSFWLQYTALIMIVLTFVIGAFAKQQPAPAVPAVQEPQILQVPQHQAGAFAFPGLFAQGSAELDQAKAQALAEVLLNHDLKASILIFESNDAAATGLALARSMTLYRFLLMAGVPADAAEVFAVNEFNPEETKVEIVFAESTASEASK